MLEFVGMKTLACLFFLCALVWFLVLPLSATQFVPLSIEEISGRSDLIVQGTVQSKTCARDKDGSIFTTVVLTVIETWKGQSSTNLSIVLSGGILGEEGVMIPGQADYGIGEEVVVFLVLNSRGEAITLGLAHGKFHVWKDPKTGEKLARNLFHGGGARPLGGPLSPSADSVLSVTELRQRALGKKQ